MRESITRSASLLDIEIARGGDGRTVTAYAAVFNTLAEISDANGHYFELIRSNAFDKSLREKPIDQIPVLFNHGKTIWDSPGDMLSVPIGTPLEVRSDPRGLLTVTRFNKTTLADEVLEAVRSGSVTAMSFRASIFRSSQLPTQSTTQAHIPTFERTELGLVEYGPATFAAYPEAKVLAVRSESQTDPVLAAPVRLRRAEQARRRRQFS